MDAPQQGGWCLDRCLARLSAQASVEALLGEATALLHAALGRSASGYQVDSRGDTLAYVAGAGMPEALVQVAQRLTQQVDVVWELLQSGQPLTVPVVANRLSPRFIEVALESGMLYTTIHPLRGLGEGWGLLFLSGREPPDAAALEALGQCAALVGALGAGLRARARQTRAEALLQGVVAHMREGVIAANAAGDLLLYNPALQALIGWTAEEVRRDGWPNLVYPDPAYRAQVMVSIRGLLQGQRRDNVWTLTGRDGSQRQVRIASMGIPDPVDGGACVFGVIEDVSEAHLQAAQQRRDELARRVGTLAQRVVAELSHPGGGDPRAPAWAALLQQLDLPDAPQLVAVDAVDAARGVAAEAARQGLEVEVTRGVEGPLAPVDGDPQALRRALLHLLEAPRAAQEAPAAARIVVGAEDRPGEVAFWVEHPASQVRWTPERLPPPEAGGLLLALAWKHVTAMGGVLEVLPGPGLRVALRLPVSDRVLLRELPHLGPDNRGTERIWVLDADPAMAETLALCLGQRGYEVEVFPSAEDLVGAALNPAQRPDLLVLEPMVPRGGGAMMLAELRSRGVAAPVLWVSVWSPEHAGLLMDETMEHLPKPFGGAELAAAARRLMDRRLVVRGAAG